MIISQKLSPDQIRELRFIISNNDSSSKEVRRAQAVIMLDNGQGLINISSLTGFGRSQIFGLRKKYLAKGIVAIKDRSRKNPKELLIKKEQEEIIKIVKNDTPKDHGYDTKFWTTLILGELIQRKYKVVFKSKTSLYLIFRKAKFSYHKPDRKYQAYDEQEVEKWRETAKIKVKKALSDGNTIVLAADEMSLSTQTTIQKVWLPQGEYPKIEVATKRATKSIYGFLNIKDGKECAFKTNWQNMYITHEVLGKLRIIYPTQKIFLIWDKAPWHKGSKAQQFIEEDGKIEVLDFPRAAPDENPQEHVWKNSRSKISHNKFINDIEQTTDEFVKHLNETRFHYSFLGIESTRRV